MTVPSNRRFAGSVVNRLWKELHAVGLIEPDDDFHLANLASNEPLMEVRAEELEPHQFDLKRRMR